MKLPEKEQGLGIWGVTCSIKPGLKPCSIEVELKVCKWKAYCWVAWQQLKKLWTR